MAYPSSIDSFTNPLPDDPRDAPSLAAGQVAQNNALVALETYVGVSGSAVAGTVTKRVADLEDAPPALPPSSPPPSVMPNPILAWNQNPFLFGTLGSTSPAGGILRCAAVYLSSPATVSNVLVHVATAGSGILNAYAGIWQHQAAGALLGVSANASGLFVSNGVITVPLVSPVLLPAGWVYVGHWFVATTRPQFGIVNGTLNVSPYRSVGVLPDRYMFMSADTGLVNTPPATLGTQTAQTTPDLTFWIGLS